MSVTKREWADRVWNPVTGCTPVGAGCDNCYAERQSKRFGRTGTFVGSSRDFSRILMHPGRVDVPYKRKKTTRYFVCSMGDLFHPDVKGHWLSKVMLTMINSPQHTFVVLTKRPDRMLEYFRGRGDPIPNVQLGVSVWDQESADKYIPILLDTPAAVRVVSIEPMLGPVSMWEWFPEGSCEKPESLEQVTHTLNPDYINGIHHVIVGGETGPKARPMHPDWARSVRGQCQAAGVPFFFKGWGTAILPKKDPDYMLIDGRRWEELP